MKKINGSHSLSDKETKPEIIYVFDALCGWCYGFSPVITRLFEEFSPHVDFLVLSGGMIKDKDIGPIKRFSFFIRKNIEKVENTTGIKFGENFIRENLNKGDGIFTSITPAKALAAFRLINPNGMIPFSCAIQKAIYYDGIRINEPEAYAKYAMEQGVDSSIFLGKMQSTEVSQIIENEFKMVAGMGVKSYPALVLHKAGEQKILVKGYKSFTDAYKLLNQALQA